MADAEERQQVVLAQRIDLDVADDDHVVGLDLEDGGFQQGGGVLLVAAGEIGPRGGGAFRGGFQAFAVGIFAHRDEHLAEKFLHGGGFSHKRDAGAMPKRGLAAAARLG